MASALPKPVVFAPSASEGCGSKGACAPLDSPKRNCVSQLHVGWNGGQRRLIKNLAHMVTLLAPTLPYPGTSPKRVFFIAFRIY